MRSFRVFALFWFGCSVGFGQSTPASNLVKGYGSVPPVFEENRGQVDAEAKYLLRGGNLNLFVTKTGPLLELKNGERGAAVRMEVVGATGKGVVTGESPTGGQSSYFRGNDPSKWIAGAPQFAQARIREVRRGVDLLCYANDRQFEYDLVVKPGTKPDDVRMRFAGAERVSLTADGELMIETAAGDLVQHRPKVWQLAGEKREEVAGRYRILKAGEVTVAVGKYDQARELVIDPVVSYSTYLGGSSNDQGAAIAVDASGNAYVTGSTNSANFPTTVGAFQVAQDAGAADAFVSKLNSMGTALLYSTFIGGNLGVGSGSPVTGGKAIAVDSSGNAYVTGNAQTSDFPTTTGAFQTTNRSSFGSSVFAVKFNSSGTRLLYSTLLGGTAIQFAVGIQVDGNGNAYIAGYTSSLNFPTTAGAFMTYMRGPESAFVTKLNAAATGLIYSTYLGGGGLTSAASIALDSSNNAYVLGTTTAADFPTTAGAFQTAEGVGVTQNAFVAEISADGTALTAATYLGATSNSQFSQTQGMGIAVDSHNNVYVTGYTYSPSFPTTAGAFSTNFHGGTSGANAFVTKFNPSLTSLLYSTYLGGSSDDQARAIAVDATGRAYVAGYATSPDFPITAGSLFGKKNGGGAGAFLAELDPTGSSLSYSTLLGGTSSDYANGVALDGNQGVYLTGYTSSLDFPGTPGAIQTVSGDPTAAYTDAFVTKLDLSSSTACSLSISPSSYAAPLAGGTSSFAITAPPGCPWVAYNPNTSAVSIQGPTNGFGNGTVSFTVTQNATSTSSVSASLAIGASTFSIAQPAGSCATPIFSPSSASVSAGASNYLVDVYIPPGCQYSVSSSASWLISSQTSSTGFAVIQYLVSANNFGTRTANLLVNGVAFPVTQAGGNCTASAALSAPTGAAGGTGVISMTASSSGCAWQASSLSPWIQVLTASGTGSASVGIVLAPNPGTAARTGQVLIAGQTVNVTQQAGPVGTPATYNISTIAGTGVQGYSGDGGPAIGAALWAPIGLAYDSTGQLYIADSGNFRVRKVGLDGNISTVAGTGVAAESGAGGPATAAGLVLPWSLAFGPAGELYIGDFAYGNLAYQQEGIIHKVSNGIITNFSTGGGVYSLAVDSAGDVYAGGYGFVQKWSPAGAYSLFAGNGTVGFSGDGGPPTSASLGSSVQGLALGGGSNVYISDNSNCRVRLVANNTINTVAGTGVYGYNGDGLATATDLWLPAGVATDPAGNVVVVDSDSARVRRFTPGGNLVTLAGGGGGSGTPGSNGDGGPGLAASFYFVRQVAIDPFGNIAASDSASNVVRLLTPSYSFCSYGLSSSSATVVSSVSTLNPAVTANSGCVWNAYSSASWITVGTASGTGPGTVTLNVAANTSVTSRTGTVNIAGLTYTVTQSGVVSIPTATSVTPSSGTGSTQMFTAVFSDPAGASYLNYRFLLINSGLSATAGCWVWADPTGIYLESDNASALLGPLNGSNSFSNSQCTLNSGSVVNSGTTSTVTVWLTFANGFAGPKNVYAAATDTAGNSSTWAVLGSFNVSITGLPSVPTATSVTPSSGSAFTQTFTAVFTDQAGAAYLNYRMLLIRGVSDRYACWVWVDSRGIFLENDSNDALLGPLNGSNSLSNVMCTLNSGSVVNSGTTSTVTVSLTFKLYFQGAKTISGAATDTLGNTSTWATLGTYTVPGSVPAASSVTPSSGSGTAQTFTAVFTDLAGASYLNYGMLLINGGLSATGGCWVWVNPNGIYLENDNASALLGPLTGSNSLSNSQCTLNSGSVVTSATTWTMTVSLTFASGFAGSKTIYGAAADVFRTVSTWTTLGTYTVQPGAASVPSATSVTPATGSGMTQTFTAVFSDPAGASALNYRMFLINGGLTAVNGCWVWALPGGIYLGNDNASVLLGPLNGSNSFSNSQCTLNSGSVVNSGTTSTLTISLTFASGFAGNKTIYGAASDTLGNTSTWTTLGTYSVAASMPAATSVTPSSGSGTTQTFTAVFTDPAGASYLNYRMFLINGGLSAVGGCWVWALPSGIYLENDNSTVLLGPLNGTNAPSNSQCTLNSGSVSNSGTTSSMTVSLTFASGFAGAKTIYGAATDTLGNSSTWTTLGTYSITGTSSGTNN